MLKNYILFVLMLTLSISSYAGNRSKDSTNFINKFGESISFDNSNTLLKKFLDINPNEKMIRFNGNTELGKPCATEMWFSNNETMIILIVESVGYVIRKTDDLNDDKDTRLYMAQNSLSLTQGFYQKMFLLFGTPMYVDTNLRIKKNPYQMVFRYTSTKGNRVQSESCFVNR